ncbi:MAG: hypothetical protein IIC76_06415 [Bacteroidetes bacterium]|nr:hypothetical protein [Bacteroidota bacterium]
MKIQLSGYANQEEIIDFLRLNPKVKLKNMFLVYSEEKQSLVLREKLVGLGYRRINFPVSGEKFELQLGNPFYLTIITCFYYITCFMFRNRRRFHTDKI